MARLTIHDIASAPEASKKYLEASLARNGFIPNLVGVLANAPTALETYLTVTEINGRTSLSLAERETVQITAAVQHGCAFCVAGHTAICYKQGKLPEELVNALRNQTTLPDAKLEAVATFTRAVIKSRGAVSEADLDAFYSAGYQAQQALEVVLGVSLATLCNFANVLAQTELNPQLEQYRWEPAASA